MDTLDIGHSTAELFAGLWHVRHSAWFLRYIEVAFGAKVPELPELEAVVVSEAESGNVQHGWVQSIATRHWVADDRGFRGVAEADVPPWARDTNSAGDAGRLYSGWAKFHFFADGDRVAVRGVLGPELRCLMVGRVTTVGGALAFTDVRVPVWCKISPLWPVHVELELPAQRHTNPGPGLSIGVSPSPPCQRPLGESPSREASDRN